MHRADVGVGDARLGAGLAEEALGLAVVVFVQELQGHVAAEGGIEGLVDRAHAARAQLAFDPVAGPAGEEAELRGEPHAGRTAGQVRGEVGP